MMTGGYWPLLWRHRMLYLSMIGFIIMVGSSCWLPVETCAPAANPNGYLRLRGVLLDAATLEPLGGIVLDARLRTGGEVTTRKPNPPATDGSGTIVLRMRAIGPNCEPEPDLPPPEQLRVVVPLDQCTHVFTIEVSEENFVDLAFPDQIMELRNPILVPACRE